jgi:putative ABC transport system permease protein
MLSDWVSAFWLRIKALLRRRQLDRDLDDELEFHLAMREQKLAESGLSTEEARYSARRQFGNAAEAKEVNREMWTFAFLETLWQDIRYGLRQLRRNPGFAAVAIITLALGIGANTAIFSIVNAVLLRSLPYRNPGRLVLITGGATPVRYEEIRAAARSYTAIGAFIPGIENASISGKGTPEALRGARVSANFLAVLGVNPLLGHGFVPGDDRPEGRQVALISASLWRRRFASDPLIIGKEADFNLKPYTIAGVLPPGFGFPFSDADVWLPRPANWSEIPAASRRISPILHVFGRLKPGVTPQQATSELAVLNRQYAAVHPLMLDAKPHLPSAVTSLKDQLVSNIRPLIWMLFGAVGFILVIACANLAGLLMARAAFRSRELAIRAALGARRARLIRQFLVESLLIAIAGGTAGTLLAEWSISAFVHSRVLAQLGMNDVRLDLAVLGFTAAIAIVAGLLSGLLPSLGASRRDLVEGLQERGAKGPLELGRRNVFGFGPRGFLVIAQVALSIVLLIGAALLVESLVREEQVNPGFQAAHLLTMRIALPPTKYSTAPKRARFFHALIASIESVPGISDAAVTLTLPMTGFAGSPVAVVEQPPVKFNRRPIGIIQTVTPAYFRTLKIPLERGREFSQDDVQGSIPVVVISESLAHRFWPAYPRGENPLGEHLLVGANSQALEIVGIVADVRQAGLDVDVRPELYRPYAQLPLQSAMIAVRTKGDPLQFVNVVRRRVEAIDPDQPVSNVRTMRAVVQDSLGQPRLMALLIGAFAGIALLLALVGIYGVVSHSAARRTHEMGIRTALGAKQNDILRLVLGQGLRLALVGVVIGESGAYGLTRVMKSLLFDIRATDPATFAATAIAFLFVTLLACYIPARRAAKVDPMVALRYE